MKNFLTLPYARRCFAVLGVFAIWGAEVQPRVQNKPDVTKVGSTYDKVNDETTVEFQQLQLQGNETQKVLLSVSASYKGQKPKQPEEIIVIVSVLSAGGFRYPDMMAMRIAVDGKRVPDVLMLNLDKRKADEDYLETIGTRMKYELFKRLLKASTAEFVLENLTLRLGDAELSKLREVDSLLHAR